jgi:8-oxo-dGTP diphosphatase
VNRIREIRLSRGLPVSALARAIGMNERTVRHWEEGRSDPTKRNAVRVARVLGVAVADLKQAATTGVEPATMPDTRPSVASCYVIQDGRLLMTKRRFREGTFEWAAISGEIEPGETPEQAAVREAHEEVGLEIEAVERLGERVHPATGRHLIYVAARPVKGAPVVVDHEENTRFDWADLETVKERWATLKGGIFPPVLAYLERTMGAVARPNREAT